MSVRILVTGSRGWTDLDAIAAGLVGAWRYLGQPTDPVLVVGRSPGADYLAEGLWRRWGWPVDPHPAGGREMVQAGADICLAFIGPCTSVRCDQPGPHPSHGATSCVNLAQDFGIPVKRWTA